MKGSIKPVPWDERFLQVLITMRKEQENWGVIEDPSDVDPRNILKKVMAQFQSLGLKPVVAFELEFYLLDKNRDENGKPVPAGGANKTHVYGIPDLDLFGRLFDDTNNPSSSYPPHRKTLPGSSAKTFDVVNDIVIKTVMIATLRAFTKKLLVS